MDGAQVHRNASSPGGALSATYAPPRPDFSPFPRHRHESREGDASPFAQRAADDRGGYSGARPASGVHPSPTYACDHL